MAMMSRACVPLEDAGGLARELAFVSGKTTAMPVYAEEKDQAQRAAQCRDTQTHGIVVNGT